MPKGITDLNQHDARNQAYIDPALAARNPRAAALAATSAVRRQQSALPRYTTPIAGGPPPPIPALEQPHREGMPMAAQAMGTMGADSGRVQQAAFAQHEQRAGSIISAGGTPLGAQTRQPAMAILPNDVLPQEAMKDPNYHQGASSQLAMNQPHMAAKYGVIRAGQQAPPQMLVNSQPVAPAAPDDFRKNLRRSASETQADLAQLAALQQQVAIRGVGDVDHPLTAPAREGAAAAANTGAMAPLPTVTEEDRARLSEEMKTALSKMDDVDFDMFRRKMAEDILKNPRQREIVEARCEPLSIDELITNNKVQQRVPVIPGRFEPTFESQTAEVEMMLKQLLTKESDSVRVTDAYLLDKYALMNTVAGVVALNGNRLPSMYDARGEFNEGMFWEKYKWMAKRPMHLLASLGIHYSWFEARVRGLFKVEEAKNG